MPWPSFETLMLDLHRAIGEIRGLLEANTNRLDRIEDRLNAERVKLADVLPLIGGLLILVLTLWGKPELAQAVASAFGR